MLSFKRSIPFADLVLGAAILLLAVGDMTTTYVGINKGAVEANPLMNHFMGYGFWVACLLKVVLTVFVLSCIRVMTSDDLRLRRYAGYCCYLFAVAFGAFIIHNNIGVINQL